MKNAEESRAFYPESARIPVGNAGEVDTFAQIMAFYKSYKEFLREVFPAWKLVRKLTIDAGFTCPNYDGSRGIGGCSYCDNRSFSPALEQRGRSVREQLSEGIRRLRARYPQAGILAYFQPYTNTYAPVRVLESLYAPALENTEVCGISIGTRPDCLPDDVVDWLCRIARVKPLIVEVGLQSAHDRSLIAMNRGHSAAEFRDAMMRLQEAIRHERALGYQGFYLGTHLIVGLPGETHQDFVRTAEFISQFELSAVKIHPLHIVRGTRLAEQWQQGRVVLLDFESYCQAVAAMLKIIPSHVAIERFTGDSPEALHLAPDWSGDRERIINRVREILSARS